MRFPKPILLLWLLFLIPHSSTVLGARYKGAYYKGTLVSIESSSKTRAREINWSEEVGPHRYGQTKTRTSTVELFIITLSYGGKNYVGHYSPDFFRTYRPTEWSQGDTIEFRLTPGFMYLKRPNGRELKTQYITPENDS